MNKRKRIVKRKAKLRKLCNVGTLLKKRCPLCGNDETFYYDKYDSECCIVCDNWLEETCGDPNCTYCANRPEYPSEAIFLEEIVKSDRKDRLRLNYQRKYSGKIKEEKRMLIQNKN